jgi:hypothetical protein
MLDMAPPRSWMLARSTDYEPNGVLQLGQILLNPLSPYSSLLHSIDEFPSHSIKWSTMYINELMLQDVGSNRTEPGPPINNLEQLVSPRSLGGFSVKA